MDVKGEMYGMDIKGGKRSLQTSNLANTVSASWPRSRPTVRVRLTMYYHDGKIFYFCPLSPQNM
jgi:hypothetical protein